MQRLGKYIQGLQNQSSRPDSRGPRFHLYFWHLMQKDWESEAF